MNRLGSLTFSLFLLVASAINAYPCTCDSPSQREKFRKADVVFLGQMIEQVSSNLEAFAYQVTFKVERQWKGKTSTDVIVHFTYDRPGWCGDLNLTKGKRFLIYAYREGQNLLSDTDCGPNQSAENATASLKKLNRWWYRALARIYPF